MAMVVVIAPNVFAINRGYILRNIAIWLAIFLGLALVYKTFGPDSPHPLFQLPEAMSGMRGIPAENRTPPDASGKNSKDNGDDGDGKDNGEQGYTPPKE
jgi:hypothetical protein